MQNKRLKQKIAALSVTGALIPFSLSAVPAMAAEQVAVQPDPIPGITLNQASVQKITEHIGSHLADSPVLKVVNQTPKTPVTKKEEEKQETQDVSLQSSSVSYSSHYSSQLPQEQKAPERETEVSTASAPAESDSPKAPGIEAGAVGATLTGLGLLGTAALAVNALPAAALLGVGALGTAALGTGAALVGAGIAGATVLGTGATLALTAVPVIGATAIGAGLLGLGTLTVAAPAAIAAISLPVILGITTGVGALIIRQTVTLGALAIGVAGLALEAGTIALGTLAAGTSLLGLGALTIAVPAAIAAVSLPVILGVAAGVGALVIGQAIALGTLAVGAAELALGAGVLAIGILTTGTILLGTTILKGAILATVLGTAMFVGVQIALGLGTLTVFTLALGTAIGLATVTAGILGLGTLTALVAATILLGLTTIGTVLALSILTGLGLGALAFLGLANLGLMMGLNTLLVGGTILLKTLALGAAILFASLVGFTLLGLLGIGLTAGSFPLLTHALSKLFAVPLATLTWMNIGRAWGRFVGSFIAGAASFVIAGVLGAVVGAVLGYGIGGLFRQGTPGAVLGALLLAPLWQILLVPLWTILGAFNGALVCTPLGALLGAGIGFLLPFWSIGIGSWLVPIFALLWDSLATSNELITHLLSWGIQWIPRYLLRWTRYNLFTEIPAILKSLLNLVTLQYGPLTNHIHKITSFSDSVDSGWGSLGYLLYGKTVVAGLPVLDSAPWLVGYALGAWVNQYALPGGRTNEILFLLDPFYLPDYNLRNQLEYLSNGSLNFWKLLFMKFFARLSVRTSQVVMVNVGSNDLWVPIMAALYDIADDGRLPFDLLTNTERGALFGAIPAMIDNVFSFARAWLFHPWKWGGYTIKLLSGSLKEFTDYFINLPLILLHIFWLNPFATVVVEGTESPVRNWDLIPGADDNLIEYLMEPVYEIQNLYKRLCTILYPGNWLLFLPTSKAVYADMHGIQLKGERTTVPTFESLSLDGFGFDPHPSWVGRRQQADRILKALGQPSPYSIWESTYLRPSIFWNVIYPYRPTSFIHPLILRIRPMDGLKLRSPFSTQSILPSISGALYPLNY